MNNGTAFKYVLNNYTDLLNCSARDLAVASDVRASVISWYRNGEIAPRQKIEQAEKIINGIIARENIV